jgi:hypothetical protein
MVIICLWESVRPVRQVFLLRIFGFFRAIQLPQQPLPIIQTLSSSAQLKPVTTLATNGQIPAMASQVKRSYSQVYYEKLM